MHNALSLNGAITNESQNAELVVLNMPLPPSNYDPGKNSEKNSKKFSKISSSRGVIHGVFGGADGWN